MGVGLVVALAALPFSGQLLRPSAVRIHNGERAPSRMPARAKIITYNIAHGRGLAGKNRDIKSKQEVEARLDEIAEFLRNENPDIVVLNEVDVSANWSYRVDFMARLSGRSGLTNYAYGLTYHVKLPFCHVVTANGLLSRFPITRGRNHRLGSSRTLLYATLGGKRLLETQLEVGGQIVTVFAVHLEAYNVARRQAQMAALIELCRAQTGPFLLVGDFNAVPLGHPRAGVTNTGESTIDDLLATGLVHTVLPEKGATQGFTFRSDKPDRTLDYVFASRHFRFTHYEVVAVLHSDHRPVIA